jgi:hypothetical protein
LYANLSIIKILTNEPRKDITIMDTQDGKMKEIWGRKFKIVKNGLDEN